MLKIEHDGSPSWEVQENCCMCRTPTRFWYKSPNVALCPECAKTTKKDDLPSKEEWCAKEKELSPRRFVNYY